MISYPLGGKIVFTNGCFDLLHAGHVSLLEQARAMGRLLIVGIDTDESIRARKGEGRPIQSLYDRAMLLSAIRYVDYVIPFNGREALERIISQVCPHILVKGEDWQGKEIVGRGIVEAHGGKVVFVPLVEGQSTTKLIERIKGDQP